MDTLYITACPDYSKVQQMLVLDDPTIQDYQLEKPWITSNDLKKIVSKGLKKLNLKFRDLTIGRVVWDFSSCDNAFGRLYTNRGNQLFLYGDLEQEQVFINDNDGYLTCFKEVLSTRTTRSHGLVKSLLNKVEYYASSTPSPDILSQPIMIQVYPDSNHQIIKHLNENEKTWGFSNTAEYSHSGLPKFKMKVESNKVVFTMPHELLPHPETLSILASFGLELQSPISMYDNLVFGNVESKNKLSDVIGKIEQLAFAKMFSTGNYKIVPGAESDFEGDELMVPTKTTITHNDICGVLATLSLCSQATSINTFLDHTFTHGCETLRVRTALDLLGDPEFTDQVTEMMDQWAKANLQREERLKAFIETVNLFRVKDFEPVRGIAILKDGQNVDIRDLPDAFDLLDKD